MDDTQIMFLELAGKGYSCAQMVMLGGLRLMGRENPDLVRSMSGLAQGVGCSGEICGALSGAACLIGLHTGKGQDYEEAHPEAFLLMSELVEWFREEAGALTCDALLGGQGPKDACRSMDPGLCGGLVLKSWSKAVSLLAEKGLDPSLGREQD